MHIPKLKFLAAEAAYQDNPKTALLTIARYLSPEIINYLKEKERIINECCKTLCLYGKIFGGAPRDYVNKDFPKDIDVVFNSEASLSEFIINSCYQCTTVEFGDEKTHQYTGFHLKKLILTYNCRYLGNMYDFNIVVKIDALLPIEDQKRKLEVDFDINQLEFNVAYPKIQTRTYNGFVMYKSTDQLITQCLAKEFTMPCESHPFSNFSDYCIHRSDTEMLERKKEMERRGWICINKPCTTPRCIFAPEKIFNEWIHSLELENFNSEQKRLTFKCYDQDDKLAIDPDFDVDRKEGAEKKYNKKIKGYCKDLKHYYNRQFKK
jgi:hypothetical protein